VDQDSRAKIFPPSAIQLSLNFYIVPSVIQPSLNFYIDQCEIEQTLSSRLESYVGIYKYNPQNCTKLLLALHSTEHESLQ
jgi:hypothetical protein